MKSFDGVGGGSGGQWSGSVEAKAIFPTLNSQNYIEFQDNIKVMATF